MKKSGDFEYDDLQGLVRFGYGNLPETCFMLLTIADAFAAKHTNADNLVAAPVKLYEDNASTLTPDPLHSAFYDSHPPASLRISKLQNKLAS